MIPPVQTTTATKSKTDFSIDWIVKNDAANISKNNIVSDDSVSVHHINKPPSLPKDYETEISKALRIPPHLMQREFMHSDAMQLKMPLDEYIRNMQNNAGGGGGGGQTTHEPIRPMPMLPSRPDLQQQASLASMQHTDFVNAQLQLAAALAHRQQNTAPHPFSAEAKYSPPMHLSQLLHHNFQRTTYPIQPWLINRHGRIFPHGFAGGKHRFYIIGVELKVPTAFVNIVF